MQLKLIIYCALLFCLEVSATVPRSFDPRQNAGINNIRPPYEISQQAGIPRSDQVWNRRPNLPQYARYQGLPNNLQRPGPNIPQQIPQEYIPRRYPNLQKFPTNVAYNRLPNSPNQDVVNNEINIQEASNKPIQTVPEKPVAQQPALPLQYRNQIVNNPAVQIEPIQRVPEANYPSQINVPIVQTTPIQKVPESATFVLKDNERKAESIVAVNEPTTVTVMNTFTPQIPSRPNRNSVTSKTPLTNVQIVPTVEIKEENKIPQVTPVKLEDRYFASASNPVETVIRNFTPPNKYNPLNYNTKQFVSNSNIRNVLATTKHKKRYLVIYPNGTIDHIDKIETVAQINPNYVMINAGDIFANSSSRIENVQKADAVNKVFEPILLNNTKPQSVPTNTPITKTIKSSGAPLPLLATSNVTVVSNQTQLEKPILTSLNNQSTATSPEYAAPPPTNITNSVPTSKAPANATIKNETVPSDTPSKIKIVYSQTPEINNTPNMTTNKVPDNTQILNVTVMKPTQKEIKPFVQVENHNQSEIIEVNSDGQRPLKTPIIIYGANVTKESDVPVVSTNSVEQSPVPEISTDEPVVKNTAQTSSVAYIPPAAEAVAKTETNPVVSATPEIPQVNESTPTVNVENVVSPDTKVSSEEEPQTVIPIENKSPSSHSHQHHYVVANATAEVNLEPPAKVETNVTQNVTKTTPAPDMVIEPSHTATTSTEVLVEDGKSNVVTSDLTEPIAPSNNNYPKNTTDLPSTQEQVNEVNTPDQPNVKPDEQPVMWFKTSDPGFWDKLREGNNQDVVYFFQIHNQPKVEYNTIRTIHPNGTIVEETTKSVWEIEGGPPIITKTTNVINPED